MDKQTAREKKLRYCRRADEKRVCENMLTEVRNYVRVEDVLVGAVADAIRDYSLCNQWD